MFPQNVLDYNKKIKNESSYNCVYKKGYRKKLGFVLKLIKLVIFDFKWRIFKNYVHG